MSLYDNLLASDDVFDWLAGTAAEFDDKPSQTTLIQSPVASPISSGSSSSASNSPLSFSVPDYISISESDSDSDSDVEPLTLSKSFHVIDGIAYETDILPVQSPYVPPPAQEVYLPPLRPQRNKHLHSSIFEDADGESDGNASDDEYIPSPLMKPYKRRASTPIQFYGSTLTPGLAFPSPPSTPSQRPAKRSRPSQPSRNVQAIPSSSSALDVPSKSNPWACPHCPWVQRNKRSPDLKRHIRTHTRLLKPAQWICRGVPVEESAYHRIRGNREPRLHGDKYFVGGCGKEFSRRDAMKRHLDNSNIGCVGNLGASASED